MPVGVEGLPVILQRSEAVQTAQTLQLNTDRAQQLAAAGQSQDTARAHEQQVEDRPEVVLDGLWSDEHHGEPYPEGGGQGSAEPPPQPTAPPDPQGRGARIDVQA